MKNMVKKNQIMITALAIMIAVAGYLNFAGETITDEEIMTTGSDSTVSEMAEGTISEDADVATLFEISDEEMQQAEEYDIESMDTEVITEQENYLETTMEEVLEGITDTGSEETSADAQSLTQENVTVQTESAQETEVAEQQLTDTETPGEAVFTSAASMDALSGAKLMKEQTRAKNKETLLEIINNINISDEQKQEAIDNMISITDVAEKETAAEILLEAKGFEDVVVSIDADTVDVVVNTQELTEAQRAQIEDIVVRKTGITAENIVISTITQQ